MIGSIEAVAAAARDNDLFAISDEECFELIDTAHIGRIGLAMNAMPVILPVNFCTLDRKIYVRTAEGTKLDAAMARSVVAFEVDDAFPGREEGWSVLVVGIAEEVGGEKLMKQVADAGLQPWSRTEKTHIIRITPHVISGRRIVH